MAAAANRIGILIESDFYENEIFYYLHRFQEEEDLDLRFLSRLWGNERLTFTGHEYRAPFECSASFEDVDDELDEFAAVIVPAGMVADRLRYTEDPARVPPATEFLARAFARERIVKGIICHGLWLCAPRPELVRGRRLTVHNNLIGDARAYGADYVDEDLVVDGDLITARTGGHCHLLAREIIAAIRRR